MHNLDLKTLFWKVEIYYIIIFKKMIFVSMYHLNLSLSTLIIFTLFPSPPTCTFQPTSRKAPLAIRKAFQKLKPPPYSMNF